MTEGLSLPALLESLHDQVEHDLAELRKTLAHPTDKGDASEEVWITLLNKYLPRRYLATKAHVVDSRGAHSDQIDVVIHDRQYSPLVFSFKGAQFLPAESIYAVFEVKQTMTSDHIAYAQAKAATVRQLFRTSLPVPTVDGLKPPKTPGPILAGILTFTCEWKPVFGDTLKGHLVNAPEGGSLDIGCIADAGFFKRGDDGDYFLASTKSSVTQFLFELIAHLQTLATVPMIDVRAYLAAMR